MEPENSPIEDRSIVGVFDVVLKKESKDSFGQVELDDQKSSVFHIFGKCQPPPKICAVYPR